MTAMALARRETSRAAKGPIATRSERLPAGDPRRAALLAEITKNGVHHGEPGKPIVGRHGGTSTRWIMSFLGVGLREPWLSASADGMLDLLERYESRQIATMGLAASSLLAACVMRSNGAYNALMVRPEPKAYGSGKQIEGVGDRAKPVVLIDDAIGSGYSFDRAAKILRADGYEVEGVAALVRFGYGPGVAWLEDRGHRVETLFDYYDDFVPIMEPEHAIDPNRHRAKGLLFDDGPAPATETLFAYVRRALDAIWRFGRAPRPPIALLAAPDCRGGAHLSLRDAATGRSIARAAVWRLPDDAAATSGDLVAEACWRLAHSVRLDPDKLGDFRLALNGHGPLEPCAVGEVDEQRDALFVRSLERPWQMAGALPAMPAIDGDGALLRHLLRNNAQLGANERFALYRHRVDKSVEPGAPWPAGGRSVETPLAADAEDRAIASALTRVRAFLDGAAPTGGDDLLSFSAHYAFLAVHDGDFAAACVGARCATLSDLARLAASARAEAKEKRPQIDFARADLHLTLLDQPWDEGPSSFDHAPPFTPGVDALALERDGVESVLLPYVAVDFGLDRERFGAMLRAKAGAPDDDANVYRRYAARAWRSDAGGAVERGFDSVWMARRRPPADWPLDEARDAVRAYLAAMVRATGLREDCLPPAGEAGAEAPAALAAACAWRLAESASDDGCAALARLFDRLRARLRRGADGAWRVGEDLGEQTHWLLALASTSARDDAVARALARGHLASLDEGGRFEASLHAASPARGDLIAARAYEALARAVEARLIDLEPETAARIEGPMRRMMRKKATPGALVMRLRAASAWSALRADARLRAIVEADAAALAERASPRTGGFVADQGSDLLFTARALEALARAASIAPEAVDPELLARGCGFLRRACAIMSAEEALAAWSGGDAGWSDGLFARARVAAPQAERQSARLRAEDAIATLGALRAVAALGRADKSRSFAARAQ